VTTVQAPELDEAFEHCRLVARAKARNFYYGMKLAPEPQRSALYCIYAWMRRADDLVDHAGGGRERRRDDLAQFRAATDAANAGEPVDDDPVWACLRHVVDRFGIDPGHFHAMIDGQLEDLDRPEYDTFEQLHGYCYRVASTVGLICITIWGYDDPAAEALATDRGIAFQLTNVIRDFREDYEMGRVYLPREDFARHELTPRELRDWASPDAARRFVLAQVDRAESFYERSEALDDLIHASCAPALWAMTAIYRGTLDKIRRDPSRIALERIALSPIQKSTIAMRAKWRAMRARNGSGGVAAP